jgi:hypothetical protein
MPNIPECVNPKCSKQLAMRKKLHGSSLDREAYYCPLCGNETTVGTALEPLIKMAGPVAATAGVAALIFAIIDHLPDA